MDSKKRYLKALFLLGLISFCLISCTTKYQKAVVGSWTIDSFYYQNEEMLICLRTNWIDFDNNNILMFPGNNSSVCDWKDEYDDIGDRRKLTWNLIENDTIPLQIVLNDPNYPSSIFNNKYRIYFIEDTVRQMLLMKIVSKDLKIISRKGFTVYDKEKFRELEKITR